MGLNNEGKVLYLKSKSYNLFRVRRNTWNYYQTLFIISMSFNVLLFSLLMLKN